MSRRWHDVSMRLRLPLLSGVGSAMILGRRGVATLRT